MSNLFNPPAYVDLSLIGVDGNAFQIMYEFKRAAKKANWSAEDIKLVLDKAKSSDYNNLLATILAHSIDPEMDELFLDN